jgi:hypothetical protein
VRLKYPRDWLGTKSKCRGIVEVVKRIKKENGDGGGAVAIGVWNSAV